MGCYGSSFVRVLAGSGYSVRWPSENNFVFADVSAPLSTSSSAPSRSDTAEYSSGEASKVRYGTQCRCGSGTNAAKVTDFVSHMNRSVLTCYLLLNFG